MSPRFRLSFTARHGQLHDVVVAGLPYAGAPDEHTAAVADRHLAASLDGQLLHHIHDWQDLLVHASSSSSLTLDAVAAAATGAWLDTLLGVAGERGAD